jgi:hypothetical protein
LFLFSFLVGICFGSLFFSLLLMHHISILSSFHLFIFAYLHIFKINRDSIVCVDSGQCFIEQHGV